MEFECAGAADRRASHRGRRRRVRRARLTACRRCSGAGSTSCRRPKSSTCCSNCLLNGRSTSGWCATSRVGPIGRRSGAACPPSTRWTPCSGWPVAGVGWPCWTTSPRCAWQGCCFVGPSCSTRSTTRATCSTRRGMIRRSTSSTRGVWPSRRRCWCARPRCCARAARYSRRTISRAVGTRDLGWRRPAPDADAAAQRAWALRTALVLVHWADRLDAVVCVTRADVVAGAARRRARSGRANA